ncbi:MAG: Hsp20/alpha crystallin family protein [Desulfobacterales bacterium]|jgi:HSP20 family molecular chaperone IbpA
MTESKELQVKAKQQATAPPEQTDAALVFTPQVDISETDSAIILLADMPGVAPDDIKIDLREGVLTLTGNVKPWRDSAESDILVEFQIGKYFRKFTLSEAIDQEKIEAQCENGVLRLTLPKVAKAIPRRITVKTT